MTISEINLQWSNPRQQKLPDSPGNVPLEAVHEGLDLPLLRVSRDEDLHHRVRGEAHKTGSISNLLPTLDSPQPDSRELLQQLLEVPVSLDVPGEWRM